MLQLLLHVIPGAVGPVVAAAAGEKTPRGPRYLARRGNDIFGKSDWCGGACILMSTGSIRSEGP